MSEVSFQPDWMSAPGATIAAVLEQRGISLEEFADRLGYSNTRATKLLRGHAAITLEVARSLERAIGGTEAFWLAREDQFREDVARLENTGHVDAKMAWLNELPVADMIKLGWLEKASTTEQKISVCLKFFGTENVIAWRKRYGDVLKAVSFRTSESFDSEPGSVLAWLRYGELQSDAIKCRPWDPKAFQNALLAIRGLTRLKHPRLFIGPLKKLCAQCGVALVIAKAPNGCRASGATKFLTQDKAMVLLSFRYLSDDQFWFTFFHEAGHLLLHSNKALFLEDKSEVTSTEEHEANLFAEEILIPKQFRDDLSRASRSKESIMRLAVKLGISTGIVVGQLQHKNLVRRDQFNRLKRRFNWQEIEASNHGSV